MKKLYRKGTVHPSPPSTSDHLSFLPAAILALAVALSPEEKEVLAYLISSSFGSNHHRRNSSITTTAGGGSGRRCTDHPVSFNCYCFGCYMSYWVKWDSSPNRQLIHEIIDAFEDAPSAEAANGGKKEKSKKVRRKNNKKNPTGSSSSPVKSQGEQDVLPPPEMDTPEPMEIPAEGGEGAAGPAEEEEMGKGSSVRRFVGFVSEKIWGIWS